RLAFERDAAHGTPAVHADEAAEDPSLSAARAALTQERRETHGGIVPEHAEERYGCGGSPNRAAAGKSAATTRASRPKGPPSGAAARRVVRRVAEGRGVGDHQRGEARAPEGPVVRPADSGNPLRQRGPLGRERALRAELRDRLAHERARRRVADERDEVP